ncbi:MAG: hypothetical protein Q4A95_10465 [Enterococcus hirae]|nr:hypothetical protein [Enterococcus hirae]
MKKHYLACLLCLFFLFALPVQGFAVAGGHGGGSTRSGGSGGSFGGSSVGHHFYDDRPIIGRSRGYYRSSSYGDVEDYVLMGRLLLVVLVSNLRQLFVETRID